MKNINKLHGYKVYTKFTQNTNTKIKPVTNFENCEKNICVTVNYRQSKR